jgi:hypothetical protein
MTDEAGKSAKGEEVFKPAIQPWDEIQTKGAPRAKSNGGRHNMNAAISHIAGSGPVLRIAITGLRSGNLDLSSRLAPCGGRSGFLRRLCLKLLNKIVIHQGIEVPGHSGKAVNDLDIAVV